MPIQNERDLEYNLRMKLESQRSKYFPAIRRGHNIDVYLTSSGNGHFYFQWKECQNLGADLEPNQNFNWAKIIHTFKILLFDPKYIFDSRSSPLELYFSNPITFGLKYWFWSFAFWNTNEIFKFCRYQM